MDSSCTENLKKDIELDRYFYLKHLSILKIKRKSGQTYETSSGFIDNLCKVYRAFFLGWVEIYYYHIILPTLFYRGSPQHKRVPEPDCCQNEIG